LDQGIRETINQSGVNAMIVFWINLAYATPLTISYKEAMDIASRRNPEIHSTHLDVERAQGGVMEAKGVFDPTLNLNFGRNHRTQQQFYAGLGTFNSEVYGPSTTVGIQSYLPTGTRIAIDWITSQNTSLFISEEFEGIEQQISPIDTTLTMTLTQSLLQGYRYQFNMQPLREAQRSLSISELIAIETLQESLAQTASAYWNVVYQLKLVELAKESLKISKEEQRIVQAQVAQGELATVEIDRVEATTLAAQSALIDAENAYLTACESLLLLLGEDSNQQLILTTTPEKSLDEEYDVEQEITQVKKSNPTLKRMQLLVSAAEERVQESQHAKLPELNATARYSVSGWEDEFSNSINEMTQGGLPGRYIGLNLDVPIANWADKGAHSQRVTDRNKAQKELESMGRTIVQQVSKQVRELHSTQAKSRLAAVNLSVAEKTLASDRALRDAGRNIEKDVLDSIKAVEDARVQYERALADHQLAKVELLKLRGEMR